LKTPSRGGTGVGLGTDGGDGHQRRRGPRCGRGRDGRWAASRAVRRPRRLGPQRGGGNLPVHGVLAVFSKPATYPGLRVPPKQRPDLHRRGGIAEKTSIRRKNLDRPMGSCTFFWFGPYGLSSL